jgi:hypothetical protein
VRTWACEEEAHDNRCESRVTLGALDELRRHRVEVVSVEDGLISWAHMGR